MPFQAHWTQVPSAFSGMKQQSQLWNSQQHSPWNSQPSTTDVLTNSNSSGEFLVGLNQLLCLAANTSPPKFWSPPAFGHCKLHFSQAKQGSVKATPNNTSAVEMLSSGITKSRNTWNNKIQKASQHPKTQNSFIPQSAAEPGHSPILSQKDNLFSCCLPPHFISSSVALRGAGLPRELRALLSLWAPTRLLKSNPAFPKPLHSSGATIAPKDLFAKSQPLLIYSEAKKTSHKTTTGQFFPTLFSKNSLKGILTRILTAGKDISL